jgi:chaperone BCS1
LDGVASSEERIIFMTTNHLGRLDPALIRPGRVDVKQILDYATDSQITDMFVRFYGSDHSDAAESFLKLIRSEAKPVSTAQLQGHFVIHKDSATEALTHFREMY